MEGAGYLPAMSPMCPSGHLAGEEELFPSRNHGRWLMNPNHARRMHASDDGKAIGKETRRGRHWQEERDHESDTQFEADVFSDCGSPAPGGGGSPAFGGEGSASGALDGKIFVVEQGEKGESANETDTLIFKSGKFRSVGCDKYGFGEGAYSATIEGDTIRFVAETTSEKKGKMRWEGTVRGNKIDVTYVWIDRSHWYKPSPKPLEKWAKGELKKPE